jgi:acid phosphatase (class A)
MSIHSYRSSFRVALMAAAFAVMGAAPALAQAADASGAPAAATAPAKEKDYRLRWLDPVIFSPDHAFAPPPARGSQIEQLEFDRLRALIKGATPERLARADWDGEHEDPSAYAEAAGRDFTKLPATTALLDSITEEVDRMVKAAKAYFKRPRPYQLDTTLRHCEKGGTVPNSYPSGHAGFGWSTGWTLARLIPDRAPQIIARAQDYELSRELCGVHFVSDLAASHGAATAAVEQLLADPRLAAQVAAARAELAKN